MTHPVCSRYMPHALSMPYSCHSPVEVSMADGAEAAGVLCSQDFMMLGRAQAEMAAVRQHQLANLGNFDPMVCPSWEPPPCQVRS